MNRRRLFQAAALALPLGVAALGFLVWRQVFPTGSRLNRAAWRAGFTERGLAVPKSGPREGFWGARLGKKVEDAELGWYEPEVHLPDLVEVDERGLQHAAPFGIPARAHRARLLLVGASTAFGAYASAIATTYFQVLADELGQRGLPVTITVLAGGAWKSEQELKAVQRHVADGAYDLVLFLNGLNDLTNGSNARTRFGVETPTRDGRKWDFLYHEHDYEERARVYLDNMTAARDWLRGRGIDVCFVLQPNLIEKPTRSRLEERLVTSSLRAYRARPEEERDRFLTGQALVRAGLSRLAYPSYVRFVDASRLLSTETVTTFADLWHFPDPGHRILGHALADEVAAWWAARQEKAAEAPVPR